MSSNSKTLPPSALPEKSYDEVQLEAQRALTGLLESSEDPALRVVAHMSNRQLAMVEQLSEVNRAVAELSSTMHASNYAATLRTLCTTTATLATAISRLTAVVGRLAEARELEDVSLTSAEELAAVAELLS